MNTQRLTHDEIIYKAPHMFKRTLTTVFAGLILFTLGVGAINAQSVNLKITDVEVGAGTSAEVGMNIFVHYTGKLKDGTVFDSSVPRGNPFSFTLGQGQVIQGWEQGLLGMKVGGKRTLTIPPELGYGATGAGGVIPGNATLIFDIELIAIKVPVMLGAASVEDLKAAQDRGAIVIDIRREEEWKETGVISGAHTITAFTPTGQLHPDFQDKFFHLITDPDTLVMLYCRTGNRTEMLGDVLIQQVGLTHVSHLTSGIVGWMKSGATTVPYSAN